MSNIDLIGYTAAILTTAAFVPQAYKVIKTKDTKALSLTMFLILTCGLLFWVAYGIMRQDKAIIIANTVTGILSIIILITKLKLEVPSKQKLNQDIKPFKQN